MNYFRIRFRNIVGLTVWMLIVFTSSTALAQSQSTGQPVDDGISSFIFSPRAVTVVLVLVLIAQLYYRYRVRNARVASPEISHSSASSQPAQSTKKRYDRDEISKLLKASATSKNNGRSLEEAIRLSQAVQNNMLRIGRVPADAEIEIMLEAESEIAAESFEPNLVEAEQTSVEVDSSQQIETSK